MKIVDFNNIELLKFLASKYVWWKKAGEAMECPERIIAQVMNIGDFDDVVCLVREVGEDKLREVLASAEAGQFSFKSWHYWHYRLGLAKGPQDIPDIPLRRFC